MSTFTQGDSLYISRMGISSAYVISPGEYTITSILAVLAFRLYLLGVYWKVWVYIPLMYRFTRLLVSSPMALSTELTNKRVNRYINGMFTRLLVSSPMALSTEL